MQSKISSFFKPSSSSPINSLDLTSSYEERDDELADWEKTDHTIRTTYKRRPSKFDRSEVNQGSTIERPILEDLFQSQELTNSTKFLNKKRNYAQLHLELGQSDFLLHTCSTCGVKYAPGDEMDEKNHRVFHKNYTHGVQLKGWRNERIVDVPGSDGRVILVLSSDPPAHKNKVQEVLKMMETDLGDSWIFHNLCKVYMLISSQRVVGCLIAENITEAFKVKSSLVDKNCLGCTKTETRSDTNLQFGKIVLQRQFVKSDHSHDNHKDFNGHDNRTIVCENEATPAVCGIRAIWVTPSNRRNGIATLLLEALRRSFSTDIVLAKSQLAFSHTTSAGKALASKYMGTGTFLVYRADTCTNVTKHS